MHSLSWNSGEKRKEEWPYLQIILTVIFFIAFLLFYLNSPSPFFDETATITLPFGELPSSPLFSALVSYFLADFLSTVTVQVIEMKKGVRDELMGWDLDIIGASFLLTIGFYLVTLVCPLFFGNLLQKETSFLVNSILFVSIFLAIPFLTGIKKQDAFRFRPDGWILDLFQLILLILIVFIVNSLILSVPRLLNPALIFLFSLALMPFMNEEFWFSLIPFHKRVLRNLEKAIKWGYK